MGVIYAILLWLTIMGISSAVVALIVKVGLGFFEISVSWISAYIIAVVLIFIGAQFREAKRSGE